MLIMKMLTIGENLKHLHINTLFMSWTKKTSKTKKKNRYRASNGGAREQFIEDQIWIYLLHL